MHILFELKMPYAMTTRKRVVIFLEELFGTKLMAKAMGCEVEPLNVSDLFHGECERTTTHLATLTPFVLMPATARSTMLSGNASALATSRVFTVVWPSVRIARM